MFRPNVFHCLRIGIGCGVLAALASAQSGTYYRDSPRASDADKIATQMLNDAASGRFRPQNYGRPYNPFDQKIEEYENAKRAKTAEYARYAAEAERRRAETAAEEREEAAERARQRQVEERVRGFHALQDAAKAFDAQAHLRLGLAVESGNYPRQDLTLPPGYTEGKWALARYTSALVLGLDVGVVASGCMESKARPAFHQIWARVQALNTADGRANYLADLAGQGHVGANLWLGAWYAGFDVSLGGPPPAPAAGETHRRTALRHLERAHRSGYSHATAWYAEVLMSDPATPAERAQGLALLAKQMPAGPDRELAGAPAYARELLRAARVEADFARPRAILAEFETVQYLYGYTAWAAMHLDGTDGEYHPGRAARVLGKIPDVPLFGVHHIRRHLSDGIDAYFGIDSPVNHRTAYDRVQTAATMPARVRGSVKSADLALRNDSGLWRAFIRAEERMSTPNMPDPLKSLGEMVAAGNPLSQLLFACATLGRPATSAAVARTTWNSLAPINPFTRPLSPPEILLVLRCALRAHERGGLPELAPFVEEIRALPPHRAPVEGAALLARLYFSPLHPRDVAERGDLAGAYATFVRAAWRDPRRWEDVAALVEVLQVDPLTPAQWNAGWLAPLLEKHPAAGVEQKRWAAQLADPAPAATGDLALRSSASLSLRQSGPPHVQALDTSLRLRGATDNEQARLYARSLLGLARAGNWHAQALVEDFSERYRPGYVRRRDLAGFRRDAREAAEAVAGWREKGHAFMLPNDEQRMHAIGTALALGSTRFTREILERAAANHVKSARVAVQRLQALAADPRTPAERDDDEIAATLWEKRCAKQRVSPDTGSTLYRLGWIGSDMAAESGADAAIAFWWRQSARYPALAWQIAVGHAEGHTFFKPDPAAALVAFRRAASVTRHSPRFAELIVWADTIARHGTAKDYAAIDFWLQQPRYGVERWRFPDEKGFSLKLNPPVATADRLAAAALTRGVIIQAVHSKAEVDRAQRLNLLAVSLGAEAAVARLRRPPFATLPDAAVTLAKALLETSTMNAPIAVELLRPVAAQNAGAARLLVPWIEPASGRPTPRLQRILARRKELADTPEYVHVDPLDYRRGSGLDHGWLPWEQAQLVRAAKAGDTAARAILVDHQLMLPALIDVTPPQWVERTQRTLASGDPAALWSAATEAPALWRLARNYWESPDEGWVRAARTIGALGVRLAGSPVPAGRTHHELSPLLEIGLEGGHGPSFTALHQFKLGAVAASTDAERRRASDAIVLALAETVLDRDLGNAAFLETVALPLMHDTGGWNGLFAKRLLYTDDSTEPTSVLLFARENAAREAGAGRLFKGESIATAFFPADRGYRLGRFGYGLLTQASTAKNPLAARALATLGFPPGDHDEILRP